MSGAAPSTDQLFDDASAIRRVGVEACLLAGAARAILLQVAHPLVGQGVAEHSRFTEDPLARLRGTLSFVYGTVFGSVEEADWIAGVVNGIHRHVVGAGYSADDPELQLWVAATLYQSAEQVYGLVFGPMPTAMAEELCRQSSVYATSLGCPAELWPATLDEFRSYWDRQVATLEISEAAKEICRNLYSAESLPWYLRALLPLNSFITAALLPDRMRNGYGFTWSPRRERLFRGGVRAAHVVYPRLPKRLRAVPTTYYLRGFRERFQKAQPPVPNLS